MSTNCFDGGFDLGSDGRRGWMWNIPQKGGDDDDFITKLKDLHKL
jgi:hypothetical protein